MYRWRRKWTPDGDKIRYAAIEEENKAIKLELAEFKMERDMLKKAMAYFANLRKVSRYMSETGLSSVHNNHRTRCLTNSKKTRGDGYPNLMRGQTFTKPHKLYAAILRIREPAKVGCICVQ